MYAVERLNLIRVFINLNNKLNYSESSLFLIYCLAALKSEVTQTTLDFPTVDDCIDQKEEVVLEIPRPICEQWRMLGMSLHLFSILVVWREMDR